MQKSYQIKTNILYFILWGLVIGLSFQNGLVAQTVRYEKTESGLEFGIYGFYDSKKPMPILFVLVGSAKETINDSYSRQCGNILAKENGWLCVTLDLPFHGRYKQDSVASELISWRDAIKRKEDFVTENNLKLREILNYLILKGKVDSNQIYASGISRGGYLALHFAAFEPKVKAVVCYAPVTSLNSLIEFNGLDLLPVYDLNNYIEILSSKNIWIVIGDRDERVGTNQAFVFSQKINHFANLAKRNSNCEFHIISEPQGHHVPKYSDERSANWLLKQSN